MADELDARGARNMHKLFPPPVAMRTYYLELGGTRKADGQNLQRANGCSEGPPRTETLRNCAAMQVQLHGLSARGVRFNVCITAAFVGQTL